MLPILEHSSPLVSQTLPTTTDTLKSPPASLTTHPPVLTPLPHLFSPRRTIKDAWSLPSAPLPPPPTQPPSWSSQIPGYSPHHTHCLFPFTITDKVAQADERRTRGSWGVSVANEGALVALLRLGSPHWWPSHQFLPGSPPGWPNPGVPTAHLMVQGKSKCHFSRQHALTGTLLKHTCS